MSQAKNIGAVIAVLVVGGTLLVGVIAAVAEHLWRAFFGFA